MMSSKLSNVQVRLEDVVTKVLFDINTIQGNKEICALSPGQESTQCIESGQSSTRQQR